MRDLTKMRQLALAVVLVGMEAVTVVLVVVVAAVAAAVVDLTT